MRRRTSLGVLIWLLVSLLASGCGVSLPSSGPVVQTTAKAASPQDDLVIINPRGPGKGDAPEDVVRGFLEAMTATPPIKTSVAREFLTAEAREAWQPTGIIAYSTTTVSGFRGSGEVELTANEADHIDERGTWLGPLTAADATFQVRLEKDHGEWRISTPPKVLMVPKSWFEQRLRQASLYFFDPTGTLLVPEPVFAPAGLQFASTLVNGLLQGPSPGLASSELTFLPEGLRPVVSVPVSEDGVAKVDLISDSPGALPAPPETERLVAQLAWTLRQDPTISAFQLTIGGREVKLSDGEDQFSVEQGSAFAPYVADTSPLLYGLRDGKVVAGTPSNLDEVAGPFGRRDYQLRSVSLDMRADQAAGVTSKGTTLWLGSLDDQNASPTVLIHDGTDLLAPAWDFEGRVWAVDRRAAGAVVEYSNDKGMRELDVPGITGQDVKDFLVSRDGSRIVAVVRRDARNDAVVVSRVLTTGDGRIVRALAAHDVTTPETTEGKIRDIAWRSSTDIVYLQPVSRRLLRVRSASVDGASIGVETLFVTIPDEVLGLVGTPTPDQPTYAFVPGGLIDLAGPRDQRIAVDKGVTGLTYVG